MILIMSLGFQVQIDRVFDTLERDLVIVARHRQKCCYGSRCWTYLGKPGVLVTSGPGVSVATGLVTATDEGDSCFIGSQVKRADVVRAHQSMNQLLLCLNRLPSMLLKYMMLTPFLKR